MAILVRASFQMRAFEDRFITLGLPYRVIGGPRFYERQEIRDAIAYLEVTRNPANDLDFERIVNVPKRGLGDTTVKRMHELARARAIPLYQAAREIVETEELTGKARQSLADLLASLRALARPDLDSMRHTELAELILEESGYTAMWQADKSPQAQARLENLKELVRFMDEFETPAGLPRARLAGHGRRPGRRRRSRLAHDAARGQGAGVRRGVPARLGGGAVSRTSAALDENGKAGLEEERRLAYVGLTRAKRHAKISLRAEPAQPRALWQSALPSRFLDELPEAHVEVIERKMPLRRRQTGGCGRFNPYGHSRFDEPPAPFQSGLRHARLAARQRAQQRARSRAGDAQAARAGDARRRARRLIGGRARLTRSASACSTRSSATARSPTSTATSSPSISTRPGGSAWSTASSLVRADRMAWSAAQYVKFEEERSRPVRDLLARVPNTAVATAVDIGCGPGNSTQLLLERFPNATVAGLDSSADMIAAARKRLPGVLFEIDDITAWCRRPNRFDVILANAVLQWVPDHAALLPALLAMLAPGGSLAVQIPHTLEEPAPRLMREIAADGPWAQKLAGAATARTVRHGADWYFRLLRDSGAAVDMWLTTYYHQLAGGAGAVVEWFKGSGLRPFLEPLDAAERSAFLARYQAGVAQAYPALPDGTVLLPFPRLFFVATR